MNVSPTEDKSRVCNSNQPNNEIPGVAITFSFPSHLVCTICLNFGLAFTAILVLIGSIWRC